MGLRGQREGRADPTAVRRAQAVAAALAVTDAAYAGLLARRSPMLDRMLGESTGLWRDWGVGLLAGYAAVQGYVAARPAPETLGGFAMLRGLCAAGHVAALPVVPSRRKPVVVALLAMNVSVALLGWRARSVS